MCELAERVRARVVGGDVRGGVACQGWCAERCDAGCSSWRVTNRGRTENGRRPTGNLGCHDIAGRCRAGCSNGHAKDCRGPTAKAGFLRAGCSRCTGGTPAPTGGSSWAFVERLPPAQPVVPVGPAASSSHPQAEITAQEFLQWMQNGTERQEAWVKLIAMVIEKPSPGIGWPRHLDHQSVWESGLQDGFARQ